VGHLARAVRWVTDAALASRRSAGALHFGRVCIMAFLDLFFRGCTYPIHTSDNAGFQTCTPPTSGRGNDWILILEDADAGFILPGATDRPA
jgi:collagenase-like protein with putative collagen-binding domain